MSEVKHSPGPWHVHEEARWPFKIEIVDACGEVVSSESRHSYSTSQRSLEEVMSAYGFGGVDERDDAIAANQRQLANVHLRAAAPQLLEAAKAALALIELCIDGDMEPSDEAEALRAAISKANGA